MSVIGGREVRRRPLDSSFLKPTGREGVRGPAGLSSRTSVGCFRLRKNIPFLIIVSARLAGLYS